MQCDAPSPPHESTPDFLTGGGATGAMMRSHDWSQSPLGAPQAWPQPLRIAVGLLLQSRFPMFVAWGPELGFLYNDAYAVVLGAKHPTAMGSRFHDIWAEIWPDISPLIDAAMAGQATYREDLPLLMNRKGYDEQTWFTFSYSPLRGDDGQVAGMFCACTETTSRVVAERNLRELNETLERRVDEALAQRKLLADIVEGTNIFVQVADLDYRWLAINRAAADEFERIFGQRPRVGESMLHLLAEQPEHQSAVQALWGRALAGEQFVEVAEFGDPGRDRRSYEMRFNTLLDAQGRRIGAYQFVYDVTERLQAEERLRQAEETLRQAQKMESLGQLTGGVAHDFNNLLAVFANGLQLLELNVGAEQRQRVYAGMRRAIARGTGLTHHLLAFSRRRAVNPESINLVSQLTGMKDMLQRSLRGDIRVEMSFGGDLWPVHIDAGEFELAMLNLCVNARDAMVCGGTITITAENFDAMGDDEQPAQHVKLCVTDPGCGMTPEVLERVFEPFFTTKDVGKGSGLGLPQVYGFVQQSGGQLKLDSEIGSGTTVTMLLPRSRSAPCAAADTAPAGMPRIRADRKNRGQVLLVEDDAEVAALTQEMLAYFGFAVIHAASPAAALGALANDRGIDFVFSDIMMPGGVSGLELAREIRRRQPSLPVVLTTGYADSAGTMAEGDFQLLMKPYDLEALAQVLGIECR